MKTLQNEYYYKSILQSRISDFIAEVTKDENELGYLSDNIEINMCEAAWLILKQNIDTGDYYEREVIEQ